MLREMLKRMHTVLSKNNIATLLFASSTDTLSLYPPRKSTAVITDVTCLPARQDWPCSVLLADISTQTWTWFISQKSAKGQKCSLNAVWITAIPSRNSRRFCVFTC
ncbi:hypothetical protein RRG08_028460 [Elysia crispata]|uniref:Uncharacterized protein n=1 Tax=Elysia crispata TaxID=231223 RepID=A0AAE1E4T0_9GAST|nr:hypothetical protein RRG08_028460 [Elysia crispata]